MEGAEITKPCARLASITQTVVFFQTHFEGVGGTKAPHGLVGTCDYQKEGRQQRNKIILTSRYFKSQRGQSCLGSCCFYSIDTSPFPQ